MVQCMPKVTEVLTGRTRERPAWFWRRVKQVEVRRTSYKSSDFDLAYPIATWLDWRDACWQDVAPITVDQRIHVDPKINPPHVRESVGLAMAERAIGWP